MRTTTGRCECWRSQKERTHAQTRPRRRSGRRSSRATNSSSTAPRTSPTTCKPSARRPSRIKVNEGGSLVCCEVGCIKPDFGSSIKTRAPYNAALHLRSRHLVHMLRARATAAAAALVPKPKLAKAGAPVGSAAGAAARLGMALVPRDQVGATRLCEHAAAQAHNPPPPRPRRFFCGVVVAPSAAPGVFFFRT